jgi:hypothetical protein
MNLRASKRSSETSLGTMGGLLLHFNKFNLIACTTHRGKWFWFKQEQDSDGFQDLHQLQPGNTHNFFQQNFVLRPWIQLNSMEMEAMVGM